MDLPIDSIICHDVTKPFPLPDQCIDVVFTSPPYWGLRDYGIKSIFGGDPNCRHKWKNSNVDHDNLRYRGDHSIVGNEKKKEIYKGKDNSGGKFCSVCGAWQGQLGLEPHPQMFIDHLVLICREIKRVLKKSGSFYLNLGDTYCGSGCGTSDYLTEKSKSIQGIGKNKNLYKTGGISAKLKYDGCWLQPKQLLGIPERVMIALQNDGWILRNKNVWHKLSSMPSSVKTRLNNTWEPVFRFVKLSNKREWCIIGNIPNKDKYPDKYALCREFKEWSKNNPSIYSNSGNVYKISEIPEKYYPIIMRLDEYFDLDAIREPHKITSLDKAKYGFNLIPRAWEQEVIPVSGGENVNIDCHPAGKNPGDVLKHKDGAPGQGPLSWNRKGGHSGYYNKNGESIVHPLGKNPGDIIEYDSKYKDATHGQTPQGFTRVQSVAKGRTQSREDAKKLFPNDPKKQQEYINYIHDHGGHPMGPNPGDILQTREIKDTKYKTRDPGRHLNPDGKNPGDVVKHDIAVGCIGDFSHSDPLHTKEYHPAGHNPGDFWSLATQPFTGYNPDLEHFAVFPENLVLNPLKSSCPINGVVLDPFCGRGTVGKVAKNLGLHYILFDIKPEYCELARLYIAGQKYKLHRDQSKLGAW